jgi:hypothetical protein
MPDPNRVNTSGTVSETSEISGVPLADRKQVIATAQQLIPLVVQRISKYPVVLATRIPAVCLSSAAVAPETDLKILTELATFLLVIFTIDDFVDGSPQFQQELGIPTADLLTLCNKVVQNGGQLDQVEVSSKLAPPAQQLVDLLASCCQVYQNYSAESQHYYYPFFVYRFERLMETMNQELLWQTTFKTTNTLPSMDEYLLNGSDSIASPAAMAAFLTMLGLTPTATPIELNASIHTWEPLEKFSLSSGIVIRLVNDIGGFERELAEQKPNSVLILMQQANIGKEEAKSRILGQADTYLKLLENDLVQKLPLELQKWGESVVRLTRFSRDYSLTREFYDFSKQQLANLAHS